MSWIEERDSGGWLRQAIPYFRAFGFFGGEELRSDEAVIAMARAYHGDDWAELVESAPDRATADQWLLVTDASRVWFHDLEGVYRGEDFYAASLREWATISRGLFPAEQMRETWRGDAGPVDVSFALHGASHTFVHQDGHDDFIHLDILGLINRLIEQTGYRFEQCDDLGDCRFIVVLNREEKARLARERGWNFCYLRSSY